MISTSLACAHERVYQNLIVFFNTVPGRDHSGKVSKDYLATSFLRNHLKCLEILPTCVSALRPVQMGKFGDQTCRCWSVWPNGWNMFDQTQVKLWIQAAEQGWNACAPKHVWYGCQNKLSIGYQTWEQKKCFKLSDRMFDELQTYQTRPNMIKHDQTAPNKGSFCRYRGTDYVSLRKTKEIKDRKQNNSK